MERPDDYNADLDNKVNKSTGAILKVDSEVYFYPGSKSIACINIFPQFIQELNLTDKVTQEIITTSYGRGILILPKSSKNIAAGSGYQANPADDSTDSGLNYHTDEHVQIHTG